MRNNAENMSCNLYEMWRRQSYNALRVILTTLIFGLITSSNLSQSTTVENDEADIRVVYACERTELSISCPNNGSMSSVIRIVNAIFGRLTNDICAVGGTPSVTCRAERSSEIVKEMCDYKPNCSIWANFTVFHGDPCAGTAKYLSVTYKCTLTGCSSEEKRKITWPKTDFGTQASVHCPNNTIGMAYRRCGQKHWEDDLDLSECVSKDLLQLSNQVKSNFSAALRKMETFSQKSDLYGGDLSFLADFLVNVTGLINSNPGILNSSTANKTTELILNSVSNLLSEGEGASSAWTELPVNKRTGTASQLLAANEEILAAWANSFTHPITILRNMSGFAFRLDVVDVTKESIRETLNFTRLKNNEATFDAHFEISQQDLKNRSENGLGRVTFILYDKVENWMPATTSEQNSTNSNYTVNTKIIAASIISTKSGDRKLQNSIKYTLSHKKSNFSEPKCVFWNLTEKEWSGDGCNVTKSESNETTCSCNHLTNFAVLMTVKRDHIDRKDEFALSVITYIGCAISIICLILAFLTFNLFRNLQCDRTTIHKNLIICLLISEVIFVFGIVQHDKPKLCAVIAGFLHYFFLASFSWMFMEGVQLYVLLIEVFEAEKSRVKWYYLGGYGVPSIIVFVSVIVAAVKEKGYGTAEYCWLSVEEDFIWAFVGPAIAVTFVNSVMLGVTIYMMCKHASNTTSWKMKEKTKIATIGSWLRGAVILIVLLGTTWIFGIFYVNRGTIVFAYIFTILNCLQGLFIFVFHCLTNDKVQKEYRRVIQRSKCLPECCKAKYGGLTGSGVTSAPNQSTSSGLPNFLRKFGGKKKSQSLSSSSFQKSSQSASSFDSKTGRVLVIVTAPEDGSAKRRVKRHVSSTSDSARLTDSSGFGSHESDILENTEDASGYLEPVITKVDENEFALPDICESSAMDSSIICDATYGRK